MDLNEYVVAIPSYKRADTLNKRTLALLQDYKIDKDRIFIFVANQEEKEIYQNTIDNYYNKIIIGEEGIKNIRNFMAEYFQEGQHILFIDDDIYRLEECFNFIDTTNKKHNKLQKLNNLHDFIELAFKTLIDNNLSNWGVYPVYNPYFMKTRTDNINDYTTTKLVYNIGFFTGVINCAECEVRTVDDKEDYERSIKYYLNDNGLLRFNHITAYTRCYKESGGMQVERTIKRIHDSAVYLSDVYPELCSLNTSKKSGYSEIRLNDTRQNKCYKILNH
tara:strand:+ start:1 stop:828 length:828 start_codon:yes stop_codon:yes gene_type:complete